MDLAIQEQVDLAPFNTMGLHAEAKYFVKVKNVDDLENAFSFVENHQLESLVIGGGSNVLFRSDFDGLVILNAISGVNFKETADSVLVKAGAGENWHGLVLACIKRGYGGIENLSLIPGSVGAAPVQNIGAYGVELEDIFISLEAFFPGRKEIRSFDKEQCGFGYRDSIFKNELKGKAVITSVTLRLSKTSKVNVSYKALSDYLETQGIITPDIKQVSDAVISIRQRKLPDPKKIGNTGSFFKNPVISVDQFNGLKQKYNDLPGYPVSEKQIKIPAGWLIDKAGWKGFRDGDAGVHDKQALVLVNHGKASGKEIWNLAEQIQLSIKEKYKISLIPEVNVIG